MRLPNGSQGYGGAIAATSDDDSAFSHRNTLVEFVAATGWTDPAEDDERGGARRFGAAVELFASGVYVNVLADGETGAPGLPAGKPPGSPRSSGVTTRTTSSTSTRTSDRAVTADICARLEDFPRHPSLETWLPAVGERESWLSAGVPPLPRDEELAARLQDRDEAAFASLVDSWSSGMLRLARSFVSTDDSAAEVVQEAWLAVIEGIAAFEGRSSLKTWVYRIVVNIAKRRGARESRSVPWSSLSPTGEETVRRSIRNGSAARMNRMQATGASSRRAGPHRNSRRWPARSGRKWPKRSTSYPTASES